MCWTHARLATARQSSPGHIEPVRPWATWEARHEDVTERFRYLYSGEPLSGWPDTLSRTIDGARRVHVTFTTTSGTTRPRMPSR